MRRRPRQLDPKSLVNVMATVVTLATALSVGGEIRQSISDTRYDATGVYIFLLFLIITACFKALYPRPTIPPITSNNFRPFAPPTADDRYFFPRERDAEQLISAVTEVDERITYVFGYSGVGKSTLVHRNLTAALEDRGWKVHSESRYEALEEALAEFRATLQRTEKPTLLVLDQLEQYIGAQTAAGVNSRLRQLSMTIAELCNTSGQLRVMLVVRPEWSYELRHMGALRPSETNVVDVAGPSEDRTPEAFHSMKATLADATSWELAEHVINDLTQAGELSPVLYQLVGAVVEHEFGDTTNADTRWYDETIGGIVGAVKIYRDRLVASAPDPRVATKVLLALSTRTRFRVSVDRASLSELLYERAAIVKEVIDHLKVIDPDHEQPVVVETSGNKLSLAHDYLAAIFQGMSSGEISSRERDNVLFHFEPRRRGPSNRSPVKPGQPQRWLGDLGAVEVGVLVVCFGVILARLLYLFDVPWWPELSRVEVSPSRLDFIRRVDVSYLPIALAQGGWAIYIAMIHARVFRRLNEPPAQRLLSRVVLFSVVVAALLAAGFTEGWVVTIGGVGCLLGVKLWLLGRWRLVSEVAGREVSGIGIRTAGNLFLIGGLGAIGAAFWYHLLADPSRQYVFDIWTAGVGGLLLYGVLMLGPVQASRRNAAEMLGLLARTDEPLLLEGGALHHG